MTKAELLFNFYWLAYIVIAFVVGSMGASSLSDELSFWFKDRLKNSRLAGFAGSSLTLLYTAAICCVLCSITYSVLLWRGSPTSDSIYVFFSKVLPLLYHHLPTPLEFPLEVQLLGVALLLQLIAVFIKPFVNYKLNRYNKHKSQQLISRLQEQAQTDTDRDASKSSTFIKYY